MNSIKNMPIVNYKNFSQYLIKKGKKNTIENIFKKGLIHWIKTIDKKNFDFVFKHAFLNTTPYVGVKTKRKGSKNIYVPIKITQNRGKFLSSKWMLSSIYAKKNRNLHESIIEELIESSAKRSNSTKKYAEFYALAEESLNNLK